MPFNFSKKFDFLPQVSFPGCEPLEVIYETRLLGVIISSNLSWASHVNDITMRATKKLWVLIRFRSLGGTTDNSSQCSKPGSAPPWSLLLLSSTVD